MTSSSVQWEMLNQNTGKWEILTDNNTPGIQDGLGNLQLTDGRSGTYRASVEFNGQRWYPPPPRWRARTTPQARSWR